MKAKQISEGKAERSCKKAQLDIITTLPQPIIEIILGLLPIEEATRTSILSTEWRYKWTTIPKLVFDWSTMFKWIPVGNQFSDLVQKSGMANDLPGCKLFCAIHQVLLLRQGPIHEFALCMETTLSGFEIDQILLHLSSNHPVKKLTLDLPYELPLSLFSLHHLTNLYLESCTIIHKPIFNGFGELRSLSLEYVTISKIALLHLLSNCPSLTKLSLVMFDYHLDYQLLTITEIFNCSPMIEHLTILRYLIRDFTLDMYPRPTFTHLKYFCLQETGSVFLEDDLCMLALLIKCSPNLEKIKMQIDGLGDYGDEDEDDTSTILKEYSDIWLEHLNELEIVGFRNDKLELELVKIIIAKSPNLKKVKLLTQIFVEKTQQLELLKILSLSCAPGVEIIIE